MGQCGRARRVRRGGGRRAAAGSTKRLMGTPYTVPAEDTYLFLIFAVRIRALSALQYGVEYLRG
jgi:hypothetical protein